MRTGSIERAIVVLKTAFPDFQWQRVFPLVAAIAGYGLALFTHRILSDADIYWHIKTGEWILQHGAVPHTDPFSYTFSGVPWMAIEWLSEILMALVYEAGQWNGIVIFFGVVTALTFWLLAKLLSRQLAPLAGFIVFLLSVACIWPSFLARPHLLALPILVVWFAGLLAAQEKGERPSFWLLPLMALWANLHGSFVFGLALVLPVAVEAVMDAKPNRLKVSRDWALFFIAALVMCLATPNTWHTLVFPFQLLNMKHLSTITEWMPPNFKTLQPLELVLMATLVMAFTRPMKISIPRLLILLGVLHLALHHGRHQMLAGIVGALVLAKPLANALGRKSSGSIQDGSSRRWVAGAAAMAVLLTAARMGHPIVRKDDRVSPTTALDHVPAELRQEAVLNSYNFGGYLIFSGIRPFIDGRADMYGDDFIFDYVSIMTPNRAALDRAIEKYGIQWMILKTDSSILDMIDALPSWRRLYADKIAVVYVRQGFSK